MTAANAELLTKHQAAELLNMSTRTIDRLRAAGYDLGEFRVHPLATPRFKRSVILSAIATGKLQKIKKK